MQRKVLFPDDEIIHAPGRVQLHGMAPMLQGFKIVTPTENSKRTNPPCHRSDKITHRTVKENVMIRKDYEIRRCVQDARCHQTRHDWQAHSALAAVRYASN